MARWYTIAQAILLAAAAASPAAAAEGSFTGSRERLAAPAAEAGKGRYIVELQPSTGPSARQETVVEAVVEQISSLGYDAKLKDDYTTISSRFKGVSVEIANEKNATAALDDIKSIPGVAGAWPVYPIALNVSFEVTAGTKKWNPHAATRVDELHGRNLTGGGQRVCVVDSGVDVAHPALAGRVAGGRNLVDEGSNELTDCAGHGTFVSSVIAASHKDFAGVAPASEIYMYKVFGCADTTSNDLVLKGILAADSDGCDIISVSIGSNTGYANSVMSRVASQVAQDRLLIIAAGNSGEMGPYFASSPAAGRGVVSVGSVEAAQTMGWPATLVSSSGESLDISYVTSAGTKFNETIDVPIVLDAGDSCNVAGSGDENTAVLAKRGVCFPAGSYRSLAGSGYGYGILFDSYNQGAYYMSDVPTWADSVRLMAVTAASVGDWAAAQVGKNGTLRLRIQADAEPAAFAGEVPSAGQVSSFTSWGPTYENDFSPVVSAPGGVVYGAFPDNKYAISSGTSFATPYVAGVAALYFAHVKKDRSEFVRRLTSTAVALPAFDASLGGRVVSEVASLAQQGAGLVDAAKIFGYATVLLSEPTLSLNDTDNRAATHTIRIRNDGDQVVTYNVSHVAAATVQSRNVLWYPNTYFPPLLASAGSLAGPKTVTVAPGATQDIEITLTAPDAGADSGALWSGKVILAGSNDELIAVPYIGIEASTYNWTPLHHGPESYRYDESNGDLLPLDSKPFRPAEGDSPETYFAFRYGTYEFSMDLVGVDWTTEQFAYPLQHGSGSKAWLGSVRSEPIEGEGYMDFPMRDVVRFSLGRFITFRSFANGTAIPSGRYRIFTRALRIFGDAEEPKDWQLFLSEAFSIQLGDDPIPGQNATFTTRAATSTAAATATETAPAITTSAIPATTAPVSVPGPTSTLTAAASPTGLSGGFASLKLQRLREDTAFIADPEAWMELHVKISLPDPVPTNSVLTFGVPAEIIDIAADVQLSAPAGLAGSTSFDAATGLYTIELGDWTTWNKNMEGDFFLMCRFSSEFAATMRQGTYVVQFPTVGKVHEASVYYAAVDRTAVYERLATTPYDGAALYTAEVEVPAALGPWDFVRLETSHAGGDDGFVCDRSGVLVGHEFDAENRITKSTDVTASAVEICNVKTFRAVFNETLTGEDVLRFAVASIQGDRAAWTLDMAYLLDVQLSNGTLVLYDQRTLSFEKNTRLRNWSFNSFTGERANRLI